MLKDARGLPVSAASAAAVAALDRSVESFVRYQADTGAHLNDALEADPGYVLALCYRGYLLLGAANPAHRGLIARTLATAQAAAAHVTPREQQHVAAFGAWAQGRIDEAFRIWCAITAEHPTDLMALQTCDRQWFRYGQTAAIRERVDLLAPAWHDDTPGIDCFLATWAFGHEETGDYGPARRGVEAALAVEPRNFLGHHVKAHVLEMQCRPREGSDWLETQRPLWDSANALAHHLAWHQALMRLDLGERESLLATYDAEIRNLDSPRTKAVPDFHSDLQNGVALLWRLEHLGLDVGHRWEELADKAEARIGEAGHLLLVPHLIMALAATGRAEATARFLTALRAVASDRTLWEAGALTDVVIPVCEAAVAHRLGRHAEVVALLEPRQETIRLLGGSNAQRDMFTQMLLDAAVKAGRHDLAAAMLAHETATRTVPPSQRAGYAAAAAAEA